MPPPPDGTGACQCPLDNLGPKCYRIEMSESRVDPEIIKAVLRATYDAAADHFDAAPLSFWERCGRRTVELAGIEPGASVLDVGCGTGAATLPAAARVGPAGQVRGIDLASRLLDLGRAKAAERGLRNVDFAAGDLTSLDLPDGGFDVVMCAFAIFLAPDLDAAMAGLWRAVRPGGTLAITTWGARLFEPANTLYWDAVEAERPDLRPAGPAQARIAQPEGLSRLFTGAGAPAPDVVSETMVQPVAPETFWTIVLGSGHRLPLDWMSADAVERVRAGVFERMRRERVTAITSDVLYARARRPR